MNPKFYAIVLSIALFATSCKKDDTSSGGNSNYPSPPPPPQIAYFSPGSGAVDSIVTITGMNFDSTTNGNEVAFGGIKGTVVSASKTSLAVKVPVHAINGKITVKVGSNTATSADDFTYVLSVRTFAGIPNANGGYRDGAGNQALFHAPVGLTIDASGNVYVADFLNGHIRKITPDGVVSTLAKDGTPVTFSAIQQIAVDNAGNIFIADVNALRIKKVTPDGTVSNWAGSGVAGVINSHDTLSSFGGPWSIAVDASNNVYVAERNSHLIRKITAASDASIFCGNGSYGFSNGTAAQTSFRDALGLAADAAGNVYVADQGNNQIRKIAPDGTSTTFAGSATPGYVDATGVDAGFKTPLYVAADAAGNVYVSDFGNNRIRKITPAGTVTTLAGDGTTGMTNGVTTHASFNYIQGIAVDAAGNVYVADLNNNCIRVIQ